VILMKVDNNVCACEMVIFWRLLLCDGECFEKGGGHCFDGRGRVCLCVILMKVDNNVCACEMVIFFTAFL
jgi:hypothetical protein